MANPENPYAAPNVDVNAVPVEAALQLDDASMGARFLNLIIDQIARIALTFVAGMVVGLTGTRLEGLEATLLSLGIIIGYYIVLEGLTGRTVGKLLTGTRVVTRTGGTPSFGQIVGRTFARFIPFEPFSFLGSSVQGWHDRMSGTRVVKVNR
jgi:uncharacterized RDD family membrane protein YckC